MGVGESLSVSESVCFMLVAVAKDLVCSRIVAQFLRLACDCVLWISPAHCDFWLGFSFILFLIDFFGSVFYDCDLYKKLPRCLLQLHKSGEWIEDHPTVSEALQPSHLSSLYVLGIITIIRYKKFNLLRCCFGRHFVLMVLRWFSFPIFQGLPAQEAFSSE